MSVIGSAISTIVIDGGSTDPPYQCVVLMDWYTTGTVVAEALAVAAVLPNAAAASAMSAMIFFVIPS